jgi:hypothetical protein
MYIYINLLHMIVLQNVLQIAFRQNPLDNPDLFCRSTNRIYRLCEIFIDIREIAIIA